MILCSLLRLGGRSFGSTTCDRRSVLPDEEVDVVLSVLVLTLRRRSVDVDVEELRRSTFALETRGNLAVRVHQRVPEALLETEADHAVLDDGQLLASGPEPCDP